MKFAGFQIVKGFVSAVLLAYLLWRADLTALWTSFSFTDLRWLLVAFALHIPGYLISVARWQVLLLTQQIQVPSRVLLSSYLVGTFFNQFLPGTVGGDVVRVYDTAKYSRAPEASLLTVIVERLMGLVALALLALPALLLGVQRVAGVRLTWIVVAFLVITLVPLWLMWSPRLVEPLLRLVSWVGAGRLEKLAGKVREAVAHFRGARGSLVMAMALSFLLQINVIIHFYLIARALSLPLPLTFFFLAVPVATFVLMLPVSINGIGVREGIYALLFSELGIPVAAALAFAWLAFGTVLVYGALGGVVYALRR